MSKGGDHNLTSIHCRWRSEMITINDRDRIGVYACILAEPLLCWRRASGEVMQEEPSGPTNPDEPLEAAGGMASASPPPSQDEAAAADELFVDTELESIAPFWRRWRATFLIVGVATLAATILVVLNVGEVEAFAAQAARARPAWLAAAIAIRLVTYVCCATVWWLVLRRLGHRRRCTPLFQLVSLKCSSTRRCRLPA